MKSCHQPGRVVTPLNAECCRTAAATPDLFGLQCQGRAVDSIGCTSCGPGLVLNNATITFTLTDFPLVSVANSL